MELTQVVINGLLLGGLYALMVLGFSIIWGVLGIVNLAHGEFVMVGALMAWVLFNPDRTDVNVAVGGAEMAVYDIVWVAVGLAVTYVTYQYGLRRTRLGPVSRGLVSALMGTAGSLLPYLALSAADWPKIHPIIAAPIVAVVAFALGDVFERGLLNRALEKEHLVPLLTTFGAAIVLANVAQLVFGGDPRQVILGGRANFHVGDVVIPTVRLMVFVVALVAAGLLGLWLARTRTGRTIRAASQHKMAARVVGIDIDRTYAITFGIAVALTAGAGALISPIQPITPAIGPELTLKAFAIVALGGLGSIPGAFIGGITLGVSEAIVGRYVGAGWAIALAFVVLVVVLLARPRGLFGKLAPA